MILLRVMYIEDVISLSYAAKFWPLIIGLLTLFIYFFIDIVKSHAITVTSLIL